MAKPIMYHRVTRGSLFHQVQGVQFPQLKQALCAASAAHALHVYLEAQHADYRPTRSALVANVETELLS